MKRLDKADPYKAWTDEECATFETSNRPRGLLTAYILGRYRYWELTEPEQDAVLRKLPEPAVEISTV